MALLASRSSVVVRGRAAVAAPPPRRSSIRAPRRSPMVPGPLSRRPAVAARAEMDEDDNGSVAEMDPRFLEFPHPELDRICREEFPDKGIANVEEARTLYDQGWAFLDVRPDLEVELVGKFKGAVNVGIMHMTKKYNHEKNEKEYPKSENPKFVEQVKKKFPNLDTKIMVACSDGTQYSMDALIALEEAGYTNLVGIKGGYYRWFRTFDNNLRRRRGDGYTEDYTKEGGDSCGIHSSGAGFERMDKIEDWVPPKF